MALHILRRPRPWGLLEVAREGFDLCSFRIALPVRECPYWSPKQENLPVEPILTDARFRPIRLPALEFALHLDGDPIA